MQMPRNGFDIVAASARMDTDSTFHHRQRWPSLDWVWDELDDLRAEAEEERDRLQPLVRRAIKAINNGDTAIAESILLEAINWDVRNSRA